MDATLSAILASWSFAPWLALSLGLSAAIYLRGWLRLRRRGSKHFGSAKLVCFLGGIATIYVALVSPLDALAPLLMQAHMVQHLLLMIVAPPLIWLGAPELPMIAGLPAYVRRTWLIPLWQLPALRSFGSWLTRPVTAWIIAVGILWLWHIPVMYQWTLQDRWVHDLEHVSFLLSSLLFWWPVVTPYPRRRAYSAWVLLPYLFLAGIQGSVLSGLLTFADHVLYPHYEQVPRLWGLSALSDQAIGGAIMWTIGSLAYLIPLVLVGRRLLRSASSLPCSSSRVSLALPVLCLDSSLGVNAFRQLQDTGKASVTRNEGPRQEIGRVGGVANLPSLTTTTISYAGLLPVLNTTSGCTACQQQPLDVLRLPIIGKLLRGWHTRTIMQSVLLTLAVLVILDGLFGPQVAPINLAGVGPWIHWRWLLVVGLLAAGNFFCMSCPFTLLRKFTASWLPASRPWPRWLSSKWPAIALLATFFWAYELFALWDSPWWTAWIAIGYFAAAFTINGLFRGAPFCRYVCPIGQFNFVYSLVSPLEVRVCDAQACTSCESHACLRGSETIPGCEMGLFQPHKQGNMDCTFCLDCVRSCPHDNVGLIVGLPAAQLSSNARFDGGRVIVRPSVTVLMVVLTAAAFLNAAWMTTLRVGIERPAQAWLGAYGTPTLVTLSTLLGLILVPLCVVAIVATASRRATDDDPTWRTNAARYALALVPMGLGMWAAHYTFHFLAGAGTLVTAAWRFAGDLGLTASSALAWACPCCAGELAPWLLPSQFFLFDLGLLVSLYVTYTLARTRHGRSRQAVAAAAPWMVLELALFALGVVILLQPMQMRGTLTMLAGGGS
ncbi:MAG: cytochrome c oxidase assembly protein [Planctomycetes bacterium]|nr:cytochrome c oxidase assembly protein [Planctomycetota bacterium]